MKRPVIVLTGGGTAGHVSVNEAIIPSFLEKGYEIHYIGSHEGIERDLIGTGHPEVTYHAIDSGKLRRYFSMKNFTDPFRVGAGVLQAFSILRKLKPEIIFSKGGFVSVPVVLAAKLARVPVVAHESDVSPGLANKIALPFVKHIFTVFEETLAYVPAERSSCSGAIIRPELFEGDSKTGLRISGLAEGKPVVIVMGGSQGSAVLNDALRGNLTEVLKHFQVIHLCGKGNVDESLEQTDGYVQFEYVTEGLPHLMAASDIALSRAGSNAIFELLAIRIPMLLVPLSAEKSRGDQILNAKHFKKLGFANVLTEEEVTKDTLLTGLVELYDEKATIVNAMEQTDATKRPEEMTNLILSCRN
ncbi:undecaprenyldiphospho-muramoylpentapeptide beta-N-acetylglucosaminyltransferase [Sporosarcina aquimarina]|uniref:UDP-N-acetylglucosamine--N-acetylmuramyl-(pentapeptide) pyrophosphoryl-undecaprenol N-acetylglucosamine transferase n=1 Tax=Sporosarcina aquimarina TaxID=114975 RepID=A0ABU4FY41_9BACL|nr:undecaprenyldiphospho-muramoylpentapeptide beta-N-acetylglucosaminyltransferase [Sporosarcina aquimarina]MDW0109571.1 undecaprenyldiphospho-muramoylpentapeptide beta-N-acetylglucosaminyltransferase [Sporosarcina aquimarina]